MKPIGGRAQHRARQGDRRGRARPALAEGRLRAAAIDAFAEEPLPPDSPLRTLGDKVLMSPHSASFNEGARTRGPALPGRPARCSTALAGNVPDNVYNRDVIPRWKERFGGVSVTEAGSQSERPERT